MKSLRRLIEISRLFLCSYILLFINVLIPYNQFGINDNKICLFIYVLLGIFTLFLLYDRFKGYKCNLIDVALSIILLINLLGIVFHNNFTWNFLILGAPIFYYFIFRSFLSKQLNRSHLIVSGVAAASVYEITLGVLQWLSILDSNNKFFFITGSFENPGPHGIFLSSCFMFLFTYMHYHVKHNIKKIILYLLFGIFIFYLIVILSRAAILGFLVSAGIYFIHTFKSKLGLLKSIGYRIVIITIIITILTGLYFVKRNSADGRIVIWKISKNLVLNNFSTGVGFNRFSFDYNLYQAKYFKENPEKITSEGYYVDYTESAFNHLLQIQSEQGIIGLLLFVLVCIQFLKSLRTQLRQSQKDKIHGKSILIASGHFGIISLLVSSLVSDPLQYFPCIVLFYFFLAIISSDLPGLESFEKIKTKWIDRILNLILLGAILIMAQAASNKRISYSKLKERGFQGEVFTNLLDNEAYCLGQSEFYINSETPEKAISFLHLSISNVSHWKLYTNLGFAYRLSGDYKNAEKYTQVAHYMVPHLVYPKYLLAKIYLESKQFKKWENLANHVLTDIEKIPSTEIDGYRLDIRMLMTEYQKNINTTVD